MITIEGVDPKMIANNLKPYNPTHPGEVLKDELEYRGISQRGLAKKMGISYSALNEVLNAKRALNTELAMMMEANLLTSSGTIRATWTNLSRSSGLFWILSVTRTSRDQLQLSRLSFDSSRIW